MRSTRRTTIATTEEIEGGYSRTKRIRVDTLRFLMGLGSDPRPAPLWPDDQPIEGIGDVRAIDGQRRS